MQKLVALAALPFLMLSGCFGGGSSDHKALGDVDCPDGTTVDGKDVEDVPGHHDAGFNATDACPEPPRVLLEGLPTSLGAYETASFTWELDNGSVTHGHSMLASLRWSAQSVADADLTAMEVYPQELVKRQHQDLPAKFDGQVQFTTPGTVYIRAYAQIQGDGYPQKEFWSDEVALTIDPVEPTGVVKQIVYPAGAGIAGDVTESLEIALGDAVQLKNDDPLMDHSCTSSDVGSPGPINATRQSAGTGVVFRVPGTYGYSCSGTPNAHTVTIRVARPA